MFILPSFSEFITFLAVFYTIHLIFVSPATSCIFSLLRALVPEQNTNPATSEFYFPLLVLEGSTSWPL